MARKRYSAEQIIVKLREAEVLEAKGKSLGEIARVIGTAEQTLFREEYLLVLERPQKQGKNIIRLQGGEGDQH